jgi:hypothetical protein
MASNISESNVSMPSEFKPALGPRKSSGGRVMYRMLSQNDLRKGHNAELMSNMYHCA